MPSEVVDTHASLRRRVLTALDVESHTDRGRLPSRRDQAAEDRVLGRFLVRVKRLWVVLLAELNDFRLDIWYPSD